MGRAGVVRVVQSSAFVPRMRRHRIEASRIDRAFDALIPADLRHLSRVHWTPVDVAVRVAALLAPTRKTQILDVGSGVGKLCAVGALSTSGMWCGVENHEQMVHAARRLSRALGVSRQTMFLHCDAFAIDWDEFDALYLYNPFELPMSRDRSADYATQIAQVQQRLATMRVGTRVLTLHGFGGVMPGTYELLHYERVPIVELELVLWRQASRVERPRA
jgi:hypothetical protein